MSPDATPPAAPVADKDKPAFDAVTITLTIVLIAVGFALHELRWVLLPFVLSGLLAYLCTPLVDWMSAHWGESRHLCAIAVFIVIVGLAALAGTLGAPPLLRELGRLVTDSHGIFQALASDMLGDQKVVLFGKPADAAQLADDATNSLRGWIGQPGRLAEISMVTFASLFSIILMLVLLFYLLLGGPKIMRGLLWLAPQEKRPLVAQILTNLDPVLWRYFLGVLLVVAYATVAAYVGLGLVLGLRHAIFLAILTGVLEMIPVVGPGASALIAGLVAVRHATGIGPIISYAIYVAALRLSIDQLLGPLVLGAAARLHPVLIIFCFLAGGALFGVPGVILAAPIALIVKVTLSTLRHEPLSVAGGE